MLADIGGDDGVRSQIANGQQHFLGVDLPFSRGNRERVVLFPGVDALQPSRCARFRWPLLAELRDARQAQGEISEHRHIGMAVLADLRRINFEVHHLGPGGKGVELSGDAIIKTGADGDQQIALRDGEVGIGGAMHAEHADRQGIVFIEGPLAHQGGGDRELIAVRQRLETVVRCSRDRPATDVQQGAVGLLNQIQCRQHSRVQRGLGLLKAAGDDGAGLHRRVLELLLPHILGNINQHRPGPPAGRNEKSLGHDRAEVGRIPHHPGVLHDRKRDAEDVRFLERIGADRRTGHLTGDHHHRHRIHLRCGDAGDKVGGTRPGGTETDADLAGGSGVGIGGMGSRLLMPHQDVTHPAFTLRDVEGVVDRKDGAAWVPEDRVHPMASQRIHQGCRPRHGPWRA